MSQYELDKLLKPFPAEDIEWRVGVTNKEKTKGLALAYVTNRAIQKRLDEVFTPMNWQNEFRVWKTTSQICGISVWSEDRKQWVTKWDGADDSATEAIKGGLSDSMKRAGYQWGIGRYLYDMPQIWVALRDGKYLSETPVIPKHLLPDGYIYPENQKPADHEKNNSSNIASQTANTTLFEKLSKFLTANSIKTPNSYYSFYNIIPDKEESIPPEELWKENLNSYKIHNLEAAIKEKIENNDLLKSDYSVLDKTLKNVTDFFNSVKNLK